MRFSVLLSCLLLAMPVAARMYQWTNSRSGTAYLAGAPPAWYRATYSGPRVLVFDRGQLIDDTAIIVSAAQREELRNQAFVGAAPIPAASAAPTPRPAPIALPIRPAPAPPIAATPAPTTHAAATAAKASELKALIDAWDQQQLEQARSLLELVPSEAKAAPAH